MKNNRQKVNRSILFIGHFSSCKQKYVNVCDELSDYLAKADWDVYRTSNKTRKIFFIADILWTILFKQKYYDIAHIDVYSGQAFFWAEASVAALRLVKKPYVLTLHGGSLPEFSKKHPERIKNLLENAAEVTTPSAYLFNEMKHFVRKITIISNPIDISRYTFKSFEKIKLNIIWLRAFHEVYNPVLAINSLAQLVRKSPSAHLWMIGPKKDHSYHDVEKAIQNFNLEKNVSLIPGIPHKDVAKYLSKAYIFLNTTNFDNTPISVIEAMASGLCVVSTKVGGISDLLEHEKDALLVPPNDPEAMAKAVERILKEPHLAAELSANARKKAIQMDWSAVLPKWINLFTEATARYEN